jgi:hypothetical protein
MRRIWQWRHLSSTFAEKVFGNIQNLDEVKAGVMGKCRFTSGWPVFCFCFYEIAASKKPQKNIF